MAEKDHQGAPWPAQIAIGLTLALLGILFTVSLADEAGASASVVPLLLLGTVTGGALAWLNEWFERGREPRKLALPTVLLIGAAGGVFAESLSDGNEMWVGVVAYAAGLSSPKCQM